MTTYQVAALEALADPTRRSIFELLGKGPMPVVEIAGNVPISRPAVSQHLKVLKSAGLVTVRPVGTRRVYGLDPQGIAAARDYFDQFWTEALASYAAVVESHEETV
ncbi:MAG: ArsR family transcriptional regulator [Aeromicrobium sp.]|nr:ArsR family transcriptional regulator [Aeromicrobium sp.]